MPFDSLVLYQSRILPPGRRKCIPSRSIPTEHASMHVRACALRPWLRISPWYCLFDSAFERVGRGGLRVLNRIFVTYVFFYIYITFPTQVKLPNPVKSRGLCRFSFRLAWLVLFMRTNLHWHVWTGTMPQKDWSFFTRVLDLRRYTLSSQIPLQTSQTLKVYMILCLFLHCQVWILQYQPEMYVGPRHQHRGKDRVSIGQPYLT